MTGFSPIMKPTTEDRARTSDIFHKNRHMSAKRKVCKKTTMRFFMIFEMVNLVGCLPVPHFDAPNKKDMLLPFTRLLPSVSKPLSSQFPRNFIQIKNIKHMLRQDWILQHLTTFTKECCKHLGFLYDHNYPLSFLHHFRSSCDDVNLPQQWAQPRRFETTTRGWKLSTQLRTSDATRLPVSSSTSKHSRTLASQKRHLGKKNPNTKQQTKNTITVNFHTISKKKAKSKAKPPHRLSFTSSRFSSVTSPFLSLDALRLHCGQSPTELLG